MLWLSLVFSAMCYACSCQRAVEAVCYGSRLQHSPDAPMPARELTKAAAPEGQVGLDRNPLLCGQRRKALSILPFRTLHSD